MTRARVSALFAVFLAGLGGCDAFDYSSIPDAGEFGDSPAPIITGTIEVAGDVDTAPAESLELRLGHASAEFSYVAQSYPRDFIDFPFDYRIGRGLADQAEEWEVRAWLSPGGAPGSAPAPGLPSASATVDFTDCQGDDCVRRGGVDLVIDVSTE